MALKEVKIEELLIDKTIIPNIDSTSDVAKTRSFIGREKAISSLLFGLEMEREGYNIFVVGPSGIGRKTFAKHFVTEYSPKKACPSRRCLRDGFRESFKGKSDFSTSWKGYGFQKGYGKIG